MQGRGRFSRRIEEEEERSTSTNEEIITDENENKNQSESESENDVEYLGEEVLSNDRNGMRGERRTIPILSEEEELTEESEPIEELDNDDLDRYYTERIMSSMLERERTRRNYEWGNLIGEEERIQERTTLGSNRNEEGEGGEETEGETVDVWMSVEEFIAKFESQYGICRPPFFHGSFNELKEISKRTGKFMLIYLHDERKEESDLFCQQILCSEPIVEYIQANFMVWGWDISKRSHVRYLKRIMEQQLEESQYAFSYQMRAPMIVILATMEGKLKLLDSQNGLITVDEMIVRLIHVVESFQSSMNESLRMLEKSEAERESRDRFKREQDWAYEQSLAEDRRKTAEKEKERAEKRHQEEEQRQVAEREKNELIGLKSALTIEPNENETRPVAKIILRLPDGSRIQRRFLAEDKLISLFAFLASQGLLITKHEVVTNFPRRIISKMDPQLSFKDAGLFPQETIFVQ